MPISESETLLEKTHLAKTLDIIKSNKLLRQEIKCWEIAASEWKPTINLMMLAIRAMEEEYANKDT